MSNEKLLIIGINAELLKAINNALSIADEINYPTTDRRQAELELAYEKIGRIVCQCIENWGYKVTERG